MKTIRIVIFYFLFLICIANTYSLGAQSNNSYNIIFISVDTLRADHLGSYGYFRNTSPNIDRLAKKGILFEQAISQASWTLPSHASIFTSLYPTSHKINQDNEYLDDSYLTLAEILKKYNYKTAAFTGGGHLTRIFGLNQGFDEYEDKINFGTFFHSMPLAMQWLEKNKNSNFFLFIHGYDLHPPYYAPLFFNEIFDPGYQGVAHDEKIFTCHGIYSILDNIFYKDLPFGSPVLSDQIIDYEFSKRYHYIINRDDEAKYNPIALTPKDLKHIIAHYDGVITYTDMWIGFLLAKLDALNLTSKTIIVITSDHGEDLGEHRYFRHVFDSYDNVIRVPLIIKHPGLGSKQKRIKSQVESIDIAPTILDLLNIPISHTFQGKSLTTLIKNPKSKFKRYAFSVSPNNCSIRTLDWHLICYRTGFKELYNLRSDPAEQKNIVNKKPQIAKMLESKLVDWLEETTDNPASLPRENIEVGDELRVILKQAGYW